MDKVQNASRKYMGETLPKNCLMNPTRIEENSTTHQVIDFKRCVFTYETVAPESVFIPGTANSDGMQHVSGS